MRASKHTDQHQSTPIRMTIGNYPAVDENFCATRCKVRRALLQAKLCHDPPVGFGVRQPTKFEHSRVGSRALCDAEAMASLEKGGRCSQEPRYRGIRKAVQCFSRP